MKSYWIESVKSERKQFPNLEEDNEVDVCVIGGGLTGLTTAYYLSKTDLKVALIEKDRICEHASRKHNSQNY
ncbi:MAG: FAD-binding oxidoreductase [Clostridia bacterium]|jgi:glycine/D-amino acid oxidase-like deaminating enzyme|nr:FAD-binding oxidoreductase [Clostridia bacterium]